jgi:hypothetical protein
MIHLAGAMLLKAMVSKRKEEIDYRQWLNQLMIYSVFLNDKN